MALFLACLLAALAAPADLAQTDHQLALLRFRLGQLSRTVAELPPDSPLREELAGRCARARERLAAAVALADKRNLAPGERARLRQALGEALRLLDPLGAWIWPCDPYAPLPETALPPDLERPLVVSAVAARGEREPFALAITDFFGQATLSLSLSPFACAGKRRRELSRERVSVFLTKVLGPARGLGAARPVRDLPLDLARGSFPLSLAPGERTVALLVCVDCADAPAGVYHATLQVASSHCAQIQAIALALHVVDVPRPAAGLRLVAPAAIAQRGELVEAEAPKDAVRWAIDAGALPPAGGGPLWALGCAGRTSPARLAYLAWRMRPQAVGYGDAAAAFRVAPGARGAWLRCALEEVDVLAGCLQRLAQAREMGGAQATRAKELLARAGAWAKENPAYEEVVIWKAAALKLLASQPGAR